MDFKRIENLVTEAKLGDRKAKENLAEEFTPFILNLSKKAFIASYEFADVQNECYKTLFKCVSLYNHEKHRFVAYATSGIKNSVRLLIRASVRRSGAEDPSSLILDDKLDYTLCSDLEHMDDILLDADCKAKLKAAIKELDSSEQELITYVYFKKCPLKKYAALKGINYSAAFTKKNRILNKLGSSLISYI